nr:cell wall lytic activity [uncultured bacterium]
MSILKTGMKGAPIKRLQQKLGIAADGDFGSGTLAAVKSFQEKNGLKVDGIAGPDTFTAMGLHELVMLRVGSRGKLVEKLQQDLGIGADGKFGPGTRKAVMQFQKENDLAADGIAGPVTLSRLTSFKTSFTNEVVRRAELKPDEMGFDGEPIPELKGSDFVEGSAAETAPAKSLWGKVKGWFS